MTTPHAPAYARETWQTLEPYHGAVYFSPEAHAAYAALGVESGPGYFASRAAA
ncbi:helix-turn-helix domain-containing protein, partial [Streptomyces sp. A475]